MLDRVLYCRLGDLVKRNSSHLGGIFLQRLHKMPGNRFSLPVGVRRKVDLVCLFRCFSKPCKKLSLSPDGYIFRLKIMFYIDSELAFWKIPYMPVGSRTS